MAELVNDAGALRFALDVGGREAGIEPAQARLLIAGGVEYRDARDGEWWPMLRLPPAYVPPGAVEALVAGVREVLQAAVPGFAWRPADDAAIALQLGAVPGGLVAEVGLDVGAFLADVAGVAHRLDAELALFRFRATTEAAVRFADALTREVAELPA
ncbi:MAG: hypothetical protein ACJ79E_03640 [Anaeromyxobacteraceae bacterium]